MKKSFITEASRGDSSLVSPALTESVPRSFAAPSTGRDRDASLVGRALEGDRAALHRIASEHEGRVRRLLTRLLGPRDDLDDLVQTVFLELCRSLHRFRGDSALSTFIGGIAVTVARRAMRPSPWFRRRAELPEEPVDPRSGPDARSLAAERLRRTRRALAKLSAKKRIAFLLWALDGSDVEEVAALMGASVSATRSRIYYAQKELRRLAKTDPYLREMLEEP